MDIAEYSRFDVTVVGAGPSGSVLSYLLARKGLKVLLLEKARFPREKVCAGGITVRASSLIPFDFSESIEDTIYGVRLSYRLVPKRVRTYSLPLAYMVQREIFDSLAADRAREAGVRLEEGIEVRDIKCYKDQVQVNTSSGSFTTPVLVGADGANSAVVRSLELRNSFEYGLGFNTKFETSPECLKQWNGLIGLDWGIKGGYAWVFPKKTRIYTGAAASFKEAKILKPYTLKLIQAYKLADNDKQLIRGHLMPVRKRNTPLNFERVLLLGDAAGLIDPLTGEGMYNSLKSAYLAAEAILNFKAGTGALSEYQQAVEREIVPELIIARKIQKLNSVTPLLFYYYLKNNDRFWRAFCRMIRGEKYYTSLEKSLNPTLRFFFNLI
jgi:geranylgeranyl reductase family protein